jgi:hypothetical protein
MKINDKDFKGEAIGSQSVKELGAISREREKTKRLLIGAACLLFIFAAVVFVFAPEGKEKLSYILGVVLIIMALGAIGASQFQFKVPGIEVDTKTNENEPVKTSEDSSNISDSNHGSHYTSAF